MKRNHNMETIFLNVLYNVLHVYIVYCTTLSYTYIHMHHLCIVFVLLGNLATEKKAAVDMLAVCKKEKEEVMAKTLAVVRKAREQEDKRVIHTRTHTYINAFMM